MTATGMRPCSGARSRLGRPQAPGGSCSARPTRATLAPDPSWVGAGRPPGRACHRVLRPAATPTVWVGCDGGIFQAPVVTPPPATGARGAARNTAVGPWRARNNGLAITQPVYLAQTAVSDSLMLAGTQDNGVERADRPGRMEGGPGRRRRRLRDRPRHPSRRFAQYTSFTWYFQPTRQTLQQDPGLRAAGQAPMTRCWPRRGLSRMAAPPSTASAAARVLGHGVTALAFGSYRVWYCEDWGTGTPGPAESWRTLPTGTNPYEKKTASGHPAPDLNQDSLHGPVIRVAFIDDNRLLVLTQAGLPARARPGTSRAVPAHQDKDAVEPAAPAEPSRPRHARPAGRRGRGQPLPGGGDPRRPGRGRPRARRQLLRHARRGTGPARTRMSTTCGGSMGRTGGPAGSTPPSPIPR